MDSRTIEEILKYLTDELGGEWLLTGGSLVRLEFDTQRGTEDIDLVRIRHPSMSDDAARNHLFRWLIDRGLGPEWVNTAVEPFVREIRNWEQERVPMRQGKKGAIFRPSLTAFIYLKLRRGSDIDLEDIRKAIPKCSEGFDEKKFAGWSDQRMRERLSKHKAEFGL